VTFVSPPFRVMALRRRESLGVPDLPLVWVVHPMMNLMSDDIEALADRIFPQVLEAIASRIQTTGAPA
jgi:hypothetical protein